MFGVQIELEFRSTGFCGGRKTGEKLSERGENQQQTQPTFDREYGNRTRVTEVGLVRALIHCATRAPCVALEPGKDDLVCHNSSCGAVIEESGWCAEICKFDSKQYL